MATGRNSKSYQQKLIAKRKDVVGIEAEVNELLDGVTYVVLSVPNANSCERRPVSNLTQVQSRYPF